MDPPLFPHFRRKIQIPKRTLKGRGNFHHKYLITSKSTLLHFVKMISQLITSKAAIYLILRKIRNVQPYTLEIWEETMLTHIRKYFRVREPRWWRE